jgi:glucosamine-6-phosphate deaminase
VDVQICESAEDVTTRAADLCAERIRCEPALRLGLAAGSTPKPVYAELARRCRRGELDFSRVRVFALDEYVGLAPGHPRSFSSALHQSLLSHVNVDPANVHLLAGDAADPEAEAAAYEARIAACGGIDLQILGVGRNGHVAFNEPGSPFDSRTRVVTLDPSTRAANAPDFPNRDVPERALTVGLGTLRDVRRLVLLATGERKRPALRCLHDGEPDVDCPVSVLASHPDLLVLHDAAADPISA